MEFTKRFEELGLRPALIFPDREPISYSELARRIAETAQGFGSEKKLVAIVAEPTEHAVIAYLAALHGNHAVVLLPPCKPEAWTISSPTSLPASFAAASITAGGPWSKLTDLRQPSSRSGRTSQHFGQHR